MGPELQRFACRYPQVGQNLFTASDWMADWEPQWSRAIAAWYDEVRFMLEFMSGSSN